MIFYIATLLLLTITSTNAFPSTNADLDEVAGWRFLTFAPPPGFPGASPSGYPLYAPNATFTGIEATNDKFFLSLPRFLPGQPITFGWLPRPLPGFQLELDTPINAFPDWDWHRAAAEGPESASTNCSALVSVYFSKLDRCGRLWVLDSGYTDYLTTLSIVCPPKLLAFDTTTGEVLYRKEFGLDVAYEYSVLDNFGLDDRTPPEAPWSCSDFGDMVFYISDTNAPGIIVYDLRKDAAWRHTSPLMYPEPDWGVFTIAGESFTLMGGVLGLGISNPFLVSIYGTDAVDIERTVYFQAFSSDRLYSVPASALRAQPKDDESLPIRFVGRTPSQTAMVLVDPKDDSIVYSPLSETVIASLQPAQNTVTVKAFSQDLLQGVADIQIEPEQIWALSTKLQKLFRGTLDAEEVNLRILRIDKAPRNYN